MNKPSPAIERFLDQVTDQISYHPLRPSIRLELESHIQDRIDAYEEHGLSQEEAQQKALCDMGDAILVGTELNEVHQLQKAPGLLVLSALLLLTGVLFTCFLQWLPEQSANGVFYYFPGIALFIVSAWNGYPLFIRHAKKLAVSIGLFYLAQITVFTIRRNHIFIGGLPSITYIATLFYAPIATFLLYRFRTDKRKLAAVLLGCIGIWLIISQYCHSYNLGTAQIILLLSTFFTVCFMIHRDILMGSRRKLYLTAGSLLILTGCLAFQNLGYSGNSLQTFLAPRSAVKSTWDDAYNGILIQELMKQTPFTGGLKLPPEALMDYGTGAWYFASRDPRQIGIDMTGIHTDEEYQARRAEIDVIKELGGHPAYIRYTKETVTLWDILPQHYHNNYLIAVCILMLGWLPGILLLGMIGLFYVFLFSCIRKIHGKLASSLAFCCGQCLLWQTCFYVLGNFGHQYGTFPNLPLLSEGRFSILFNLTLLGLIYSAYRYDHVIEEPT